MRREITQADLDLFGGMCAIEPELAVLLNAAAGSAGHDPSQETYCANQEWYGEGMKERLAQLVGYFSNRDELRDEDAYALAYRVIYRALPDCRNCECFGSGPPENPRYVFDLKTVDANGLVSAESAAARGRPLALEVQIARVYLSLCVRVRHPAAGSYGLKHSIERWAGLYISNGAAILAAASLGFVVVPEGGGSPNCRIGVSEKSRQRFQEPAASRRVCRRYADANSGRVIGVFGRVVGVLQQRWNAEYERLRAEWKAKKESGLS